MKTAMTMTLKELEVIAFADDVDQQHAELITRLFKSGEEILATLTPEKVDLWHAVTGICTEAGELLDCVKKHVVYNKPLDVENMKEEAGDFEFYYRKALMIMGFTRVIIQQYNIVKLEKRYPAGYTDASAQQRADKELCIKCGEVRHHSSHDAFSGVTPWHPFVSESEYADRPNDAAFD